MEFSLLPYMAAVKVEFDSLTGCQLQVHSYLKKGKKTKDPLGLFTIIENLFRREAKSNTIAVSVAWEAAGKGYDIRTYASVNAKNIFSQDALQAFTDTLNDRHSETLSAVMEPKKTHDKIIAALETLRAGYIGSDTVYTIAVEQLQAVFPGTPAERIKEVVDAVNKYSGEFEISTPDRMSNFLAQTGYESNGFSTKKGESGCYTSTNMQGWNIWFTKAWKEPPFGASCDTSLNAVQKGKKKLKWTALTCDSTKKNCVAVPSEFICGGGAVAGEALNKKIFSYVYQCEGGNGNSASGDGYKYRGHGAIQLTWKKTYQSFDTWLKKNYKDKYKDVVGNPNVLDNDKELFILSAMWFWKTNSKDLNSLSL